MTGLSSGHWLGFRSLPLVSTGVLLTLASSPGCPSSLHRAHLGLHFSP